MVNTTELRGFRVHTANVGLKEDADDFTVIASEVPAVCAGVFTQSRFAGPSVVLSRESVADGGARAIVVLSRNANVATGKQGMDNAREVRGAVAGLLGVPDTDVVIASTGVIGRQYPMPEVRSGMAALTWPFPGGDFAPAARAIMTTDTHPKLLSARCGDATVVGIAKGVGMIEPNMATLLTFFCTDARLDQPVLDQVFRRVMGRTFNAVSIDTDTSTSDTAVVLANGLAGPVDVDAFEQALSEVALGLVRQIVKDGEGASKLIEVRVTGARDDAQAKRVGKSVVNSPLVKTAVHGADPNWGRVAMAIGKCEDELDIVPDDCAIGFGDQELYPAEAGEEELERLRAYLRGDEIVITVDLGIGTGAFTVYGCDLSEGYIRINADYTT
ncbi:arginine biosynthesis bifunctional protein ArgJ [Catellatospora sp. TT07R-123]|uniref:bifunctional glutamate N-acetyltransferase/amino-acid acetyltransferase ArgJ n=1 Tax=Catellatospora sp. TT07R-123 TaxID=2733863 RepID=UPI001B1B3F06|nr:bifunctional glutamate N-acetyltransferase/amino-acid acetyltransferase ArgJ [Catellatospora sp. TT07R-123]GHJ42732.1 arginine biosynthesis bifunctional protein ArgJ [Catellatospora sp. TT07R-123]